MNVFEGLPAYPPDEAFAMPAAAGRHKSSFVQHLRDCIGGGKEIDHPEMLNAQPPSREDVLATQPPHGPRYKLAIWVTGPQRELVRSLAGRRNQTIQEFLLSAVDERLQGSQR